MRCEEHARQRLMSFSLKIADASQDYLNTSDFAANNAVPARRHRLKRLYVLRFVHAPSPEHCCRAARERLMRGISLVRREVA